MSLFLFLLHCKAYQQAWSVWNRNCASLRCDSSDSDLVNCLLHWWNQNMMALIEFSMKKVVGTDCGKLVTVCMFFRKVWLVLSPLLSVYCLVWEKQSGLSIMLLPHHRSLADCRLISLKPEPKPFHLMNYFV